MCFLPALSENSTSTDKSVSSHDDIKLKWRQKQINFFTVIVVWYQTQQDITRFVFIDVISILFAEI